MSALYPGVEDAQATMLNQRKYLEEIVRRILTGDEEEEEPEPSAK